MSPLGHEIFMDVWDILKGEERDFYVCVLEGIHYKFKVWISDANRKKRNDRMQVRTLKYKTPMQITDKKSEASKASQGNEAELLASGSGVTLHSQRHQGRNKA